MNNSYYYVFDRGEELGFVIVSDDDRMPEVLAYSDSGSFDFKNIPNSCKNWLAFYEQETDGLKREQKVELKETVSLEKNEKNYPVAVSPLINPISWGKVHLII